MAMESMVDIKEEVAKLHPEAKDLLKFLLEKYYKDGAFEFSKDVEVAGMNKGLVTVAFEQLIGSDFLYGSSARTNAVRLNRTRADSMRSILPKI